MEQTIEKRGSLRSCTLTKEDLKRLYAIITKDLEPRRYSDEIELKIEVSRKGFTYKFKDFHEFMESPNLPPVVNEFSITIWAAGGRHVRISLSSDTFFDSNYWIEGDEPWVLSIYESVKRLVDGRGNLNWLVNNWLLIFITPIVGGIGLTWIITVIVEGIYGPFGDEDAVQLLLFFAFALLLSGIIYGLRKAYPCTTIYLQEVEIKRHILWKVAKYILLPLLMAMIGGLTLKVLGL